jgi:hypothetical protein
VRRRSPTAVYLGLELILSAAFSVSFTVTEELPVTAPV